MSTAEKGEAIRDASEEKPYYWKFAQDKPRPEGTQLWGIVCDQGWRESIVCTGMYEWSADWLVQIIQGKPYAEPGLLRVAK